MATDVKPRLKITYATLRNDNDELHAQFEQGLEKVRAQLLGGYHRNFVSGAERDGDGTFEKHSPIDQAVMGTFAKGTRQDVRDAIAAARKAFPEWGRRPWQERVAILRRVADVISQRQMEFSALLVMGPGEDVGAELQENDGVDGIIFTGSFEVGWHLYKNFARRFPKPVIVEMGGKNPAIISSKADLDEAAEGIMRSAFGFSGQKCSANSRVYVERPVLGDLTRRLVEKTEAISIGDPVDRANWLGPVINKRAVDRYDQAVSEARRDGRVLIGGEHVTENGLESGFFVAPTVVGDLPADHRLFQDELFIPFTVIAAVDSVDEAFRLSNDHYLGLTAGFYSEDKAECDRFLDQIEAGVVYVNRRAGATTGAWPGIQPFGGWKGSTATGKAGGGFYYVQQFMREQSQTIVD